MMSEPKKGTSQRIWNIHRVKSALGSSMCLHLPFLHALLGCDTTSCLFKIGKAVIAKKYNELQQCTEVFCQSDASRESIIAPDEDALVVVFRRTPGENLNTLHYRWFAQTVTKNTITVDLNVLPPTSAAAKFHSLHVYY